MRRLVLAVLVLVMSLAAAGIFSAHAAVQRGAGHGPDRRGFSAFAVNAQNPQVVYAGSGTGVFKSTDAGGTWQAVNVGLTEPYTFDLAIDQHHPAILYAATENGVFRSTNGARSWRQASLPNVATVALALHPRNPQVIYAGTDDAVYKSGDAGASWKKVKTARRVFAIVLDPQRPATVYVGSGGGVFKSVDAGRSWEARNRGLLPNEQPNGHNLAEGLVSGIVVNPRHPQTLYLGCEKGIYKSTDGAHTWRPVNAGLSGTSRLHGLVASLAIDPKNPQTLYTSTLTSPGLYETTNGGRRWSAIGPLGRGNVLALILDPTDPETIYAGMSDGAKAFKSTDGGRTWTALAIPVP